VLTAGAEQRRVQQARVPAAVQPGPRPAAAAAGLGGLAGALNEPRDRQTQHPCQRAAASRSATFVPLTPPAPAPSDAHQAPTTWMPHPRRSSDMAGTSTPDT